MALQSLATAAAITIALSCVDPAPAQTPAEIFTKAKLLEHQDGDVKGALATYARIVVHQDASASMQAKALYRQALCHIKLEDLQLARESFARIQKRFPGTDEALQARLMRASLVPAHKPARSPRDLTFEVQQLLVHGTEHSSAAKSALRSLHFLGGSAVPVLKQALGHSDRSVQLIAAHALAARGDGEVLDLLLSQAGVNYFAQRRVPTMLTFSSALQTLCKHRTDLWAHVKRAYDSAQGRRKADLLGFFSTARRFESIAGYEALLESKDESERTAAWFAFSIESDGKRDAEFVGRLIEVWNAHPQWRTSLVHQLRSAVRKARAAGAGVYAAWLNTVCEAARLEPEDVAKELIMRPCPVELVGALAASVSPGVRGEASRLVRSIRATPTSRGDVVPASVGEYAKLAEVFLDAATKWIAKDESEANAHLSALTHLAGLLPPAEYRALSGRVLQPDVLKPLLQVRRSPYQAQTRQFVLGFFGASRGRGSAAGYPFVEKYLPVLINLAKLDEWPVLQGYGLNALEDFVKDSWNEVSGSVRTAIRGTAISVDPSKDSQVERSRTALIKRLVVATPPVFTVEEVLTNLGGRSPSRSRLVDLLSKKRGLQQRYPAKELIAAVNANLTNPQTRVADLYVAAVASGLDPVVRDQLLRKLWEHPDARSRRDVMERLSRTRANVDFLSERYDDTWTVLDRIAFIQWLERVPGVLRIQPLLRLIDDVNDMWKTKICVQFASIADRASAPKLIELLVYRNATVRSAAESALESIRAIQSTQDDWREWYEKRSGSKPAPAEPDRKQ